MNRNWFKVLVPEVVMVFLVLAVFFICRSVGMGDKEAAAFAFAVAAFAFAAFAAFAFAAFAAFAFAVAVAAAVAVAVKEYKLPIFWVVASYLVEAAAIFFPIYLSIN